VNLDGVPAVSAGIGYLCLGLLLHVQMFWVDHMTLGGLADAARTLLIIVIAVSLVGTFVGVLI